MEKTPCRIGLCHFAKILGDPFLDEFCDVNWCRNGMFSRMTVAIITQIHFKFMIESMLLLQSIIPPELPPDPVAP